MAPRKRRRLFAPAVEPIVEPVEQPVFEAPQAVDQSEDKVENEEEGISPFELLAEDAKRMIYKLAPEALNSLRKTSKTMLASVSEWATEQNLPPIELCIIASNNIVVEMIVPRTVYKCFECLHVFKVAGMATQNRPAPPGCYIVRTEIHGCGVRLVREHLPIKYRRVEIRIASNRAVLYAAALKDMFSRVTHIGELVFVLNSLDEDCREAIDTLTTKFRIRRLKLKVGRVRIPNLREFLLALAGRVTEIELRQIDDNNIRYIPQRIMFGMVDADWGEIVVGLFEKGVTRVSLINTHHLDFIAKSDLDQVRVFLSSSPTKHVFCTTFDSRLFGPCIPDLELPINQIRNYIFGRWKSKDMDNSRLNYLRYRHKDLEGGAVDDETPPMPICQPYPNSPRY